MGLVNQPLLQIFKPCQIFRPTMPMQMKSPKHCRVMQWHNPIKRQEWSAKAVGYMVEVYYVSTIDPRYNILRVADLVNAGGHDVPPNKVVERYYRSLSLLPLAIEIADRVTLVDNTELPIECAQAWQGTVQRTVAACPNWVEAAIAAVGASKISRETWQQWANAEGL
jgi:hypothetical protein